MASIDNVSNRLGLNTRVQGREALRKRVVDQAKQVTALEEAGKSTEANKLALETSHLSAQLLTQQGGIIDVKGNKYSLQDDQQRLLGGVTPEELGKIDQKARALGLSRDDRSILRLLYSTVEEGESGSAQLTSRTYTDNLKSILNIRRILNTDIESVRGRDIVLFVGPTRAGKSTSMLYLSATKMEKVDSDEEGIEGAAAFVFVTADRSDPNKRHIGHNLGASHTFFPHLHSQSLAGVPGLLLCDFPGLLDSSGWQSRIGLDLVLRDLILAARSVRVVAVLEENNFTTTAAETAKKTLEKLGHLYTEKASSSLIAITKRNPFAVGNKTFNGCVSGVLEPHGMRHVLIQPDQEEALGGLVDQIRSLAPIESADRVGARIISQNDLDEFSKNLLKEDSLEQFLEKVLEHLGETQEGDFAAALDKTSRIGRMFEDTNIHSLLGHVDSDVQALINAQDKGLTTVILEAERQVALKLFKHGIHQFNQVWDSISRNQFRLKPDQKTEVDIRVQNLRATISRYLAMKDLTIEECRPANCMDTFGRIMSTIFSPARIMSFVGGGVVGAVVGLATGVADALNPTPQDETDQHFDYITSILTVAETLITGSFRRSCYIDQRIVRLNEEPVHFHGVGLRPEVPGTPAMRGGAAR